MIYMSQSQFRAPRGKLKKITEEEELTDEQKKKIDERAAKVAQAKMYLSKFEFGGSKTKRKTRRTKRKTKRRTNRKTKRRTKRKTKRRTRKKKRKTKRKTKRTRKKRGRGLRFSKPAKIAAIGALAFGSGARKELDLHQDMFHAAISPAAKQTYQEIMQSDCSAPFRQMVKPHHPDKGGTDEDFIFVESARQSRKGDCGTRTKTSKPERRAGESGKAARKRHNRTERTRRDFVKKYMAERAMQKVNVDK